MKKIALYYCLHLLLFLIIIIILLIIYGTGGYTMIGVVYLATAGICSYLGNLLITFLGRLFIKNGKQSIVPFLIPTILAVIILSLFYYSYSKVYDDVPSDSYFYLTILTASTAINLFTYYKVNQSN